MGGLTVDYAEQVVTLNDCPVQVTATEYRLLYELSVNAGRVMSLDQLLQRVWGMEVLGGPRLVRSFVKKLRQKLSDDVRNPIYIFTVSRVGYRMARTEESEELTP